MTPFIFAALYNYSPMLLFFLLAFFGALFVSLYEYNNKATMTELCDFYKINRQELSARRWLVVNERICVNNYCLVYEPGAGINKTAKFCTCTCKTCKCEQQSLKDYKKVSVTKSDIGKEIFVVFRNSTYGDSPASICIEELKVVDVYDNGVVLVQKC